MTDLALDLGCGKNKHLGAIGLDMNSSLITLNKSCLEKIVDIIYEVKDRNYLPFQDNSFNKIYMTDFIEHMFDIPWLMSEVHRVAKNDALVQIRFPHYSCPNAYNDSTHVQRLGMHAFDHFDPSTYCGNRYQYYTLFERCFSFKIEKTEPEFPQLDFPKSVIVNSTKILYKVLGSYIYERLSWILPLNNILIDLKVIK